MTYGDFVIKESFYFEKWQWDRVAPFIYKGSVNKGVTAKN